MFLGASSLWAKPIAPSNTLSSAPCPALPAFQIALSRMGSDGKVEEGMQGVEFGVRTFYHLGEGDYERTEASC